MKRPFLCLLICFLTCLSILGAVPSYTLHEIPIKDCVALNNNGEVVGDGTVTGQKGAFTWKVGVGLKQVDCDTFPYVLSGVRDSNDHGDILGVCNGQIWLYTGGSVVFITREGGRCYNRVNNNKEFPIPHKGYMLGFNDRGNSCGARESGNSFCATFNNSFLPGRFAFGLNNNDSVVGCSLFPQSSFPKAKLEFFLGLQQYKAGLQFNAFKWESEIPFPVVWESGTYKYLKTLGGPGGQAISINNLGIIVGNSATGGTCLKKEGKNTFSVYEVTGVIWENDSIYNLNDLIVNPSKDIRVVTAWQVNDKGEVLCVATNPDGIYKWVLLTPNK